MKLFGGGRRGGHTTAGVEPENFISQPPQEVVPAPEPEPERAPKRKVRPRVVIITVCLVLLALSAGAVAYFLWEKPPEVEVTTPALPTVRPAMQERATPPPTPEPTEEPPEETPEPTEEPRKEVERREDCYTFVLVATDQVGLNTDVILAGRLDVGAKRLDVVSIPADTLVNVSWGLKKANIIYGAVKGDMDQERECLAGLLGFTADNYMVVRMRAVERLVDTMGGINFYLPINMDYDDPTQDLHIHIAEGLRYLNGADTVNVLRYKMGNDGTGYATGDLGRINMQHALLESVAEQLLRAGYIPHLEQVIACFTENVETDLSANNLAFYAREFLGLKREDVHFWTAPGRSVGIRGGSYFELELEPWLEILNEALNPFDAPLTADNLDLLHTTEDNSGAVSTTGELVPLSSFLDFYSLG